MSEVLSILNKRINTVESTVKKMNSIDGRPKNNFKATVNPTVNDDDSKGFSGGSIWINLTLNYIYMCIRADTGAALWSKIN